MQQLEAHEVPLHKVFSSDYDFRIPDYQRPYAWEAEDALQLLDDLKEALERDREEPYFLGSAVLVKSKESAIAEVIDGQQRLTTLTILFAILRDQTKDAELRTELEKMVVEPGSKMLKLDPKPRLALRPKDVEFFREHVQTTGSVPGLLGLPRTALKTSAQEAVQTNAKVLSRALEGWSDERRLELAGMLSARTYLVVVSTPDLNSAHRIFSVMNARGLDLSPADIFKARIIGDLDPKLSSMYAAKWEDAEESLGRDDFADTFLHLRLIFSGERARRELLLEFPKQVLSRYLPGNGAEFIDDVLIPYTDAYAQIRDQSHSFPAGADKVSAWFKRLEQLDNSDWRPAALWAVRHHRHDPDWLDQFFRRLERLAASMFIRRVYRTPRIQRYVELVRELNSGKGLDARSFELSEEEKRATRAELDGELYLSTKVRRCVLLRLDEILADESGVVYEYETITVEHVLPQNPAPGWTSSFNQEQRDYWTHRVGNLVLLNRRKNSQAQNYGFLRKKEKYFMGKGGVVTFALTSQVLTHSEWTPEVIQERQERLVETLAREWDL
ncbi:DUF262 domain-containing protein [Nocardiopsis dassonvillei]|uniref:DUF262 domain-containing protein n=1 Tax=Nocardiopsis dassonvillei (strain ATCC 23218 / DSM 43111 / CIP 107115 / JCM 7437 / KCTC 9190 / NBRC 14626 / NCTC 10488 / NRRL B-5397 / IMRU 509) TaxID=446468 RepID=D7B1R0_NOCDD|nr:DUF262 domain-containing protein [Nocardiopsis dassonvillei]ADH68486.1 protein of unknown function DUF262 [Nocardiopsis dassonvillei subsp. dassonvillei DSM 43111]NKY80164.1 DUF262 domain-containing protein [Nocardiopsis dassonvillei]VEI88994.1 Uncharacterized conserved protein [Nocardiopsis dassonvillei]